MSDNVKVFLFYHFIPVYIIGDEFISSFQLSDIDSSFEYKDNGVVGSIRDLNKYMAEYTGMYYIWKNYQNKYDRIGFGHYSRILMPTTVRKSCYISVPDFMSEVEENGFNSGNFKRLFGEYDVLLPSVNKVTLNEIFSYASGYIRKKFTYRSDAEISKMFPNKNSNEFLTLREHYQAVHFLEDFETLMNSIEYIHGRQERERCELVANSVGEFNGNLVMMKWSIFDQYMTWAHPVMLELLKLINFDEEKYVKESYQKRALGFLSERMLTMFILTRNYKILTDCGVASFIYPDFPVLKKGTVEVSIEYLQKINSQGRKVSLFFRGKNIIGKNFPYCYPFFKYCYKKLIPKKVDKYLKNVT